MSAQEYLASAAPQLFRLLPGCRQWPPRLPTPGGPGLQRKSVHIAVGTDTPCGNDSAMFCVSKRLPLDAVVGTWCIGGMFCVAPESDGACARPRGLYCLQKCNASRLGACVHVSRSTNTSHTRHVHAAACCLRVWPLRCGNHLLNVAAPASLHCSSLLHHVEADHAEDAAVQLSARHSEAVGHPSTAIACMAVSSVHAVLACRSAG